MVNAALEVTREHGIEAITMRAIGDRLGVSAMALYHHVPTKDAIVKLVADAVLGEMQMPDVAAGDWQAAIVEAFAQYRTVVARYPGIATVLLHGGLLPRAREMVIWSIEQLELAGFERKEARRVYASIHLLVLGRLTLDEARRSQTERGPAHRSDDRIDAYLAELQGEAAFDEGLAALLSAHQRALTGAEPKVSRRRTASAH